MTPRPTELDHDAELLRLGALLDQAVAREKAAWMVAEGAGDDDALDKAAEAACAETGAIVDRIEVTPATTLPGLLVKLRAIAWCCSGGDPASIALGVHASISDETTDFRLLHSMLRDMSAIARSAGA